MCWPVKTGRAFDSVSGHPYEVYYNYFAWVKSIIVCAKNGVQRFPVSGLAKIV